MRLASISLPKMVDMSRMLDGLPKWKSPMGLTSHPSAFTSRDQAALPISLELAMAREPRCRAWADLTQKTSVIHHGDAMLSKNDIDRFRLRIDSIHGCLLDW